MVMNFRIMAMKTKRLPSMKHILIVSMAFLIAFSRGVIGAATAKPLEHSPGELAWAAWLQQDSGQSEPQPPPRRITTKSLFVFPNSLPACADGYRADSMGRCVKVVKVDQIAHLEFLLQKLNSQFATEASENQEYDYDMDTEAPDTSGPFQFNIPIAMQVQAPKPEDSEGSGDEIILFKKEAPSAIGMPTSLPTSAPEYIPGDMDFKIVADEPIASINNRNDTSVSTQNLTDSGTTIVISNNGKFENLTSSTIKEVNVIGIEKKPEPVKNSSKIEEIEQELKQIVNKASSILHTLFEGSHVNSTSSDENANKTATLNEPSKVLEEIDLNIPLETGEITKEPIIDEKNIKSDQLVEQIEALKDEPTKNVTNSNDDISTVTKVLSTSERSSLETLDQKRYDDFMFENSESTSNKDETMPEIDIDYDKGLKLKTSDSMDIEEKIKVISRYADVTRNTGENPHVNYEQKKTPSDPEIYPNLPHPYNRFNYYNPVDVAVSPSNTIRFPSETKPIPNNHINSQEQLLPYEKIHPFNVQKNDYPNGNYRHKTPYWQLPPNWSVEEPKDGHGINYWPRMQIIPEYPYVTSVEHNRHPMHYQSIYPNPHQASSRINLRHTSVNHRRGRSNNRDRQTEHEEPILYARGRHPHYRE